VCVCMSVCMCICIGAYVYVYECVYVWVCMCMYECVCMCMSVCMCICIGAYVYVYECVYVWVCMCMSVCMYMYECMCMCMSMSVFTVRKDLYRGKGWEGPKFPADIALDWCLPNTVDRPPARHILPFNQNINTRCLHVCAHTNISLHVTTGIFCSFLFDFIQSFKTILVLTYYVGFMTC